jgi:very-short-patch-repair endonuclease
MENWKLIQEYYDDNHTWRDIVKNFKIDDRKLTEAIKEGKFKTRSKKEATKLAHIKSPRKLTEESKRKISKARIKYLMENPDKVPYLLNHSSKESYPERYFTILFKKEKIEVEKFFRIGLYELDFCILDKKIDIEIDGNQHYSDPKIVESDIRRNEYLEKNDWDIIRINWSNYKKMAFEERSNYISELKKYINNLIDIKPTIKLKEDYTLCECGKIKYKKSLMCNKCDKFYRRKVQRPSYEQLLREIEESNYTEVGRKYGVSDNTIRNWIKYYKSELAN